MITIIDYGMGNLGSIRNMFRKLGVPAEIRSDVDAILQAEKLVLPGVGAFDAAMANLDQRGMIAPLNRRVVDDRVPTLGICLGMQLMMEGSEEGILPGLGWIKGRARRFGAEAGLKVPHMGWNLVQPLKASPLIDGMADEARFYFVHSYQVHCDDADDALLEARYGGSFHAAFARGNIAGVQFHPEKSHKFGMRLLKQFAEHPLC